MVSATDGWAVGEAGTILRWDGLTWTLTASPTEQWLSAVAMVTATDGWAVADPDMLHWDGQRWTEFTLIDGRDLFGVAMASATDGWIVGNRGLFLRYTAPTDTPPTPTPTGTAPTATAPVTPRPTSTPMATPTPMAGAPTDVTCALLWPPGVRLEWTDRSDFETAFAIEAAAGAAPFDPFMLEWSSTTATTGTRIPYESPIALAGEATYRWRVRAVNLDTGQSTLPSAPRVTLGGRSWGGCSCRE